MSRLSLWMAAAVCIVGVARAAENGIRPISNPVFVDYPDVGTSVHPIFMHHQFPDKVNTDIGPVELGGDLQLYALQLEVQLAENLSLIAVKDGYIEFNPDNTDEGAFEKDSGFADLAAGLKYVFHRNAEKGCLASAKLVVELPTGDDEVWQGNGDGTLTPAVAAVKQAGPWQFQGTVGYIQALGDEDSSMLQDAWHVSYALSDKVFPVVELNHFHVTDAGDGGARFDNQVGGAVPSVVEFEGGDLVNFGASHADENADLVTLAAGLRVRAAGNVDLGAAYEIPLTDEEDSIIESRLTIDAIVSF
jgi:hypothetical protein